MLEAESGDDDEPAGPDLVEEALGAVELLSPPVLEFVAAVLEATPTVTHVPAESKNVPGELNPKAAYPAAAGVAIGAADVTALSLRALRAMAETLVCSARPRNAIFKYILKCKRKSMVEVRD